MPAIDTMQFFLVFLAGVLCGFSSSAPLGPINLWIADKLITQPSSSLRGFLVGVISCDVAYATLACWGYYKFLDDSPASKLLGIAGGLFLVTLGLSSFWQRTKPTASPADRTRSPSASIDSRPLRDFCIGVLMVGSNPGFLMFWVFTLEVLEHQLKLSVDQLSAVFVTGIILGDVAWFLLLGKLIRRGRASFHQRRLGLLRGAIAAAFIVGGIATALHNGKAFYQTKHIEDA